MFPGIPYISTYLQSTINGYGFSFYDGKDKVRWKVGFYEKSPVMDCGELLPEEIALGEPQINTADEQYYVIDGDHVLDHEIGETLVVRIIERFTGMSLLDLMMKNVDVFEIVQ